MFRAAFVANEPESLVEQEPYNCPALHTAASICSSTFASPFCRVVEWTHSALLADVGQLGPGWFGARRERAPPIEARSRSFAAREFKAAIGAYAVPGSVWPLGRIFSTSVCGRGMTWTDTSSPTRRAAAAPASVAA